ncbi:pyruvate kinase [bacterium]|nr:pyruvate kinase [bacterium]
MDNRKTKIVCTLGPASSKKEVLLKLIDAGLNVARVNFSHGDDENHISTINLVRECEKESGKFIGVLADLKGPKIRVGKFENGKELFKAGEYIDVYLEEKLGNHKEFSINQKELFKDVKVGNKLLVDDGKVILEIVESKDDYMKVKTLNEGYISSNKGINAPGVVLTMPFVSEKDLHDLELISKMDVNAVASSFVRRPQDVLDIRKILDDFGANDVEIIAKIENQEGVDNIEEIIKVADGIMVARGDMGVEMPLEVVPINQKKIIRLCNQMGKPVITATHMLESMISCPRPTRAEAGDVANAVLDGTDAVMLSGESAVGEYPVDAVKTMASIVVEAEKIINYEKRFDRINLSEKNSINDAIGISVVSCGLTLKGAKAIFAFTETGGTAKRISRYRPSLPIIACTDSKRTCERLSYYWGVSPVLVRSVQHFLQHDYIAVEEGYKLGLKKDDVIIMTSGFGVAHGQTNTIRIITLD